MCKAGDKGQRRGCVGVCRGSCVERAKGGVDVVCVGVGRVRGSRLLLYVMWAGRGFVMDLGMVIRLWQREKHILWLGRAPIGACG